MALMTHDSWLHIVLPNRLKTSKGLERVLKNPGRIFGTKSTPIGLVPDCRMSNVDKIGHVSPSEHGWQMAAWEMSLVEQCHTLPALSKLIASVPWRFGFLHAPHLQWFRGWEPCLPLKQLRVVCQIDSSHCAPAISSWRQLFTSCIDWRLDSNTTWLKAATHASLFSRPKEALWCHQGMACMRLVRVHLGSCQEHLGFRSVQTYPQVPQAIGNQF